MAHNHHSLHSRHPRNLSIHPRQPQRTRTSGNALQSELEVELNSPFHIETPVKDAMASPRRLQDPRDSQGLSDHFRDFSTNGTENEACQSRELAESAQQSTNSLNEAKEQSSDKAVRKLDFDGCDNSINKRDFYTVFNKASDFWSQKFGVNKGGESQTTHPARPQSSARRQSTPQDAQQSRDPFNLLQENNNKNDCSGQQQNCSYSQSGYSSQLDCSNPFYSQNQQNNSSRNTTLYRCLNKYFIAGGSDIPKTPLPKNRSRRSSGQGSVYSRRYTTGTPSLSNNSHAMNSDNQSTCYDVPHSRRQSYCPSRQSSSSLRMKLENAKISLPTPKKLQELREKSDRKQARRVWNTERDVLLKYLVKKYGANWDRVAEEMNEPSINSRMVRDRYNSKLSPQIKRSRFSLKEDQLIAYCYHSQGSNWRIIAKYLPGRTETVIRNRFYSSVKKKINLLLDSPDVAHNDLIRKFKASLDEDDAESSHFENPFTESSWCPGTQQQKLDDNTVQNSPPENYFEEPMLPYSASLSEMNPVNLNNQLLDLSFNHGALNQQASSKIDDDKMIPEDDIFAKDIFNTHSNHEEFGIECLSPSINPHVAVENPWDQKDFASDKKDDCVGRVERLNGKIDDVESDLANLRNVLDGNCDTSLIDFNQDPTYYGKLTPEHVSEKSEPPQDYISTASRLSSHHHQQQQNYELNGKGQRLSREGSNPSGNPEKSYEKVSMLVDQIKSIEKLFDMTRQEIHKLQQEYNDEQ